MLQYLVVFTISNDVISMDAKAELLMIARASLNAESFIRS